LLCSGKVLENDGGAGAMSTGERRAKKARRFRLSAIKEAFLDRDSKHARQCS
jgi:hypothetical protein